VTREFHPIRIRSEGGCYHEGGREEKGEDKRGAPALGNPETPYVPAANQAFLWAKVPLAVGRV
jgi:hypothetical protein